MIGQDDDLERDERPQPVNVQVCNICGEWWEDHLYQVSYADDEEEDGVGHLEVTMLQCIEVLKNKHRGPLGPIGPMGRTGTVDFDSIAVRGFIQQIVRDTFAAWAVGK